MSVNLSRFLSLSSLFAALFGAVLTLSSPAYAQFASSQFTTIDNPLAGTGLMQGTYIHGISGSNLVGGYVDSSGNQHAFLYNLTSGFDPNPISDPAATNTVEGTVPWGISPSSTSGYNIAGEYSDSSGQLYGFEYNTSTKQFTPINDPLAGTGQFRGTEVYGISGNNTFGEYFDNNSYEGHPFVYDGTTYTPLPPIGIGSAVTGMSGSDIVGYYEDSTHQSHGFVYNGSTYTTIDDPFAGAFGTVPEGISGSDISGYYVDSSGMYHGFLYNGSTYTTINDPLAATGSDRGTEVGGIDGGNIVGFYVDSNGADHGFVLETPEPGSLALFAGLGVTGLSLLARRRCLRRS